MTPDDQDAGTRDVDAHLRGLGGWRGDGLGRMRRLIRAADPQIVEEVKWRKPSNGMAGVPVWSHDGIVCTGEPYKDKVKFAFARGAALADPAGLFNAADTGATRRAIDVREGDEVDPEAFKALVRAAVALNTGTAAPAKAKGPAAPGRSKAKPAKGKGPAAPGRSKAKPTRAGPTASAKRRA